MRIFLAFMTLAAISTTSSAGIVGWLSSDARDWEFVQKNGGITIAAPLERDGKRVLPVTCTIAKYNSGLVVRHVEVKRKDLQLAIRIITSLPEKQSVDGASGYVWYADIADLPRGRYEVFYEDYGDTAKFLGVIEIP